MLGDEREIAQCSWMENEVDIICATNSFGMDIDKPDVRFVIHKHVSKSIENYFPELGRAGRDGKSATCTIFTTGESDVNIWLKIINRHSTTEINSKSNMENLQHIADFSNNMIDCRRAILLNHFGESYAGCDDIIGEIDNANACDNCSNNNLNNFNSYDVTNIAHKAMEVIGTMSQKRTFCDTAQELYNESLANWTPINIRRLLRKLIIDEYLSEDLSVDDDIVALYLSVNEMKKNELLNSKLFISSITIISGCKRKLSVD